MADYNFLLEGDYQTQIQPDILGIIIDDTERIRTQAEVAAIEQVKTVLAQRHDVACLFPQIKPYVVTATYETEDQVESGGYLYEALQQTVGNQPPVPYQDGEIYSTGTQVISGGLTYNCIQDTTGTQHPTDVAYWSPVSPANWTLSIKRNPYLVLILVDIVLYHIHSRISPNNIPKLRIDRYTEAMEWLHEVAMGRASLTDCLNTDDEGDTTGGLDWGSNTKHGNIW